MAMAAALEHQLDSLWEESRARKTRRMEDMKGDVCRRVETDLAAVRASVRDVLVQSQGALRQRLQDVQRLQAQFDQAVDEWKASSLAAAEDLRKEQRRQQRAVAEAGERLRRQRHSLEEAQAQAADELVAGCLDVVAHCQAQVNAAPQQSA